jgi:hypothetical protein
MRGFVGAASIAAILATGIVVTPASAAPAFPPNQIRGLFDSTYASIAARVSHLGYAPTSLTGTYGKMYTRDASVQALALSAAHDDTRARAIMRYLVRYSAASGADRLPHRIADTTNDLVDGGQTEVSSPVADLAHGATQTMPAPGTVSAVDVWLSGRHGASGQVEATLYAGSEPVDTQSIAVRELPSGKGGWVTFEFLPPLSAAVPSSYRVRLSAPGGHVTWWGASSGEPSFRERTTDFHLVDYDMFDETDQLFSVALAWARTVPGAPRSYIDETWPLIRKYVDYYLDTPGYLSTSLNLIRNPILDDEGYHNTYDLLTNVFASQALHELAAFDRRYGHFASLIADGIRAHLVTTVDGKPIYGEKYEIDAGMEFHAGYSFVNLSPLAAGWYGMDRTIMANTVQAYFRHESKDWSGITMLSSMQDFSGSGHNRWVLTKSFSWELRFAALTGDASRVRELDSFLRHYDPDVVQPVAEGWILDDNGTVTMTDPGNQEHASWYLISLLRSYPALAARARSISHRLDSVPELTVSMPPRVRGSFTMNGTLFNTLDSSASFKASVRVPPGWTVTTTSPLTGTLRPGDAAPFAWTVTPPLGYRGPAPFTVSALVDGRPVTKQVFTTVPTPT